MTDELKSQTAVAIPDHEAPPAGRLFPGLSPAAAREPIHERILECHGYRRADGLWDIEGRLTDRKSYGFDNAFRNRIEAGDAIHDMVIRLTVDIDFLIVAAEAASNATPYEPCAGIAPDYACLAGLRIGAGFNRAVQERLGGAAGCTHHTELVGRLATVAIQTIGPLRDREKARKKEQEETEAAAGGRTASQMETGEAGTGPVRARRVPPHLDRCHALRRDGPVVREHYSDFYTGSDPE